MKSILSSADLLHDGAGLSVPHRYFAAAAVMIGILMASLDSSIVNVALPSIARELAVDPATVVWVANGYQVASASCMLMFASLGGILGNRNVFNVGLVAFTLASLGCAFAGSFDVLVAMRVVQGISYAAMVSIGLGLYRTIFPPAALGMVLGVNALIVSFGTALGPALGGFIISYASWPWLFLINVPLGAVAVYFAYLSIPVDKPLGGAFDYWGALVSALGMCLLVAGVDRIPEMGPHARVVFGAALLVCFALFVLRQKRCQFALLPLDIFKSKRFSFSVGASICVFVAQGLAMVTLPFLLQHTFGYTVLQSALLFTPWPLAVVFFAPLAGKLTGRVNATILSSSGVVAFAVGLGALALLPLDASVLDILWRVGVCGVGYGFFLPPNNKEMLGNVTKARTVTASGVLSTARTLGQSIGAALAAAIMISADNPGFYKSVQFIELSFGIACLIAIVSSVVSFSRVHR